MIDVDALINKHMGGTAAPSAPSMGAGAIDVDALINKHMASSQPAAEAEEPGYLEALGRGVKQGVTLGFGDEITGFLESAFTNKTYQQARDEARAKDKAAQKAHGITFGLGQIMGGAAPAIATGGAGGLAGAIRAGAGLGAASAAGESEADLTKGEITKLASDTARGGIEGGVAGGVLHGAGRMLSRILGSGGEGLIEGAATRADKKLAGDLLERVPAKTQDRALDKIAGAGRGPAHGREELARVIRGDEALLKAKASGPADFAAEVSAQKDTIGEKIGKTIEAVDEAAPGDKGIAFVDVLQPMNKLRAQAKEAGDLARVRAIDREIEGLKETWGGRSADAVGMAHIPAKDVHALVQRYGRSGFEGGSFENPGAAKELGRDLWSGVRDELHKHVEKVAADHGLTGDLEQLRMLNRRYTQLSGIEALAEAQATRAARNQPSLGDRLGQLANIGHMGHIMASPVTGIATLALRKAAPVAMRGTNVALAALVRAARSGSVPAQLVQDALQAGIPRGTIAAIAGGTAVPAEAAE